MADNRDPRTIVREIVDDPPLRLSSASLLGWTIVATGLAICTISASSACMARLDAPDSELRGMTLATGGGGDLNEEDLGATRLGPLALDEELLQRLRNKTWRSTDGRVYRLRWAHVHQFRWGMWRGRWWFVLGVATLAAGGRLLKRAAEDGELTPEASGDAAAMTSEDERKSAFRELERALEDMRTEVDRQPDKTRQSATIVSWLQRIRFREAARFLRLHHETLIQGGDSRELLERFGVTERYLQRAYSAAADVDIPESLESIEIAVRNFLEIEPLLFREDAQPPEEPEQPDADPPSSRFPPLQPPVGSAAASLADL